MWAEDKSQYRLDFKVWRGQLPLRDVESKSKSINLNIKKYLEAHILKDAAKSCVNIASFKPIANEPVLNEVSSLNYCYSITKGSKMDFYSFKGAHQKFTTGEFGVKEPSGNLSLMAIDQIDAFLIPGLCFDQSGQRIGYGQGHFDKYLSKLKNNKTKQSQIKIGVCYSEQVSEFEFKCEQHDVPMDVVITENYILEPMLERLKWIKEH